MAAGARRRRSLWRAQHPCRVSTHNGPVCRIGFPCAGGADRHPAGRAEAVGVVRSDAAGARAVVRRHRAPAAPGPGAGCACLPRGRRIADAVGQRWSAPGQPGLAGDAVPAGRQPQRQVSGARRYRKPPEGAPVGPAGAHRGGAAGAGHTAADRLSHAGLRRARWRGTHGLLQAGCPVDRQRPEASQGSGHLGGRVAHAPSRALSGPRPARIRKLLLIIMHEGGLFMALRSIRQSIFGLIVQIRRGSVCYIGGSDLLPPPLSREEEIALMRRCNAGDSGARATLIERNLRLVVYISRKFENTGISIEDLISIGAIGLIKAVNSFDPDKNIKLATYASRCIENEILMVLRKSNRLKSEVSFDEPLNTDWDGNELLLSDILGTEPDLVSKELDADVEKQMLHTAIDKLNDREKYIVGLRYGLGAGKEHTQKEVADMMGISQSYISRLEKRIIGKLREEMLKMA